MDERCVESPSLGLESNLGRLPVVTIGDKSIGQSIAIAFYFASEYGLMGKNNFEAAQVVAISEHLRELNASFQNLNSRRAPRRASHEQVVRWRRQGRRGPR